MLLFRFALRCSRRPMVFALLLALLLLAAGPRAGFAQASPDLKAPGGVPIFPQLHNPLTLTDPATGPGVSCPDPAVMSEKIKGVNNWYLYCTGDPLNSNDKNADGSLKNHYIAIWHSLDLINWTYAGDAFPADPAWVGVETNLWAPAVKFFNNQFYLYYVAPATSAGGAEIGVATSAHAAGPWKDLGRPVVPTEAAPCCADSHRAVIDPDVITDTDGQRYISFGSFFGGIAIQKLSPDGLTADKSSEAEIAIDNLFEGGAFYKHDGFWYLFVSSSGCCNGPLSGYSVNVGRSLSPLGPFLDRNGVALGATTGGGEKVIAANGNRWIGPGGNVIFQDASGQDYMLYHAIDNTAPYFDLNPGFTRRPALLDAIDWVDGWPTVRNGRWASDSRIPGPVAQAGQISLLYTLPKAEDEPGSPLAAYSDEFNASQLSSQWRFLHPLADNTYVLTGTSYQVSSHGPDENVDPTHVSILGEPAPANGNWLVETKMTVNLPFDGSCCQNFAQGSLFVYGNDTNSIKLSVTSNFDTRQTEFGKQIAPVPAGYPTYGAAYIAAPAKTTWLRIAKRTQKDGGELYSSSSSTDGKNWTPGTTWIHQLGPGAQIGISAQNTAGITVNFDYLRVSTLK